MIVRGDQHILGTNVPEGTILVFRLEGELLGPAFQLGQPEIFAELDIVYEDCLLILITIEVFSLVFHINIECSKTVIEITCLAVARWAPSPYIGLFGLG